MDPVERAIAASLRERSDLPARPADAAAIEVAAFGRRRRRRFLQVLGTGLTAVLIVGGVATFGEGGSARVAPPVASSTAPAVVPWVDTPGVITSPSYAPSPVATARFSACTADQLTALPDTSGAATGNLGDTLTFRNSSTSPCSLSGYPTSLVGTSRGQQATLDARHGTFFDQMTEDPSNLQPGQTSNLVIGTDEHCIYGPQVGQPAKTPRMYDAVEVGVPGGGVVHSPANFDGACGTSVSTFGQIPDFAQKLVSPYPGLSATLSLPRTAVAGEVLHYEVTLINRTDQTIRLEPCPTFVVSTFTDLSNHDAYALNCAVVGELSAGTARVFAMELMTPTHLGLTKFGWSIPTAGITLNGSFTIE
jgi:hypothetical protein